MQNDIVTIINLSFAAPLLLVLLAYWLLFARRLARVNCSELWWRHRRRRGVTMAGVELTLQLVNVTIFLAINA